MDLHLPPPKDPDAPLDILIAELVHRLGHRETADVSAALLAGADPASYADVLPYLAGASPARSFLAGARPGYWARFWGSRGLLRAWQDSAVPAVVTALDDEAWRPAEGALRVAARHEVAQAAPGAVRLARHELPRVRATALRMLGRAGDAEHVACVLQGLEDESGEVRRSAARAGERMVARLDLDPGLLDRA